MAIVVRYFSTTSAGAGDGTTWADRAALFSSGNWSSVITGFNFSGSDSLECRIGPGTYTCSQSLASGLFSNAPTAANRILMHGADSSGVKVTPDFTWTSDLPPGTVFDFPRINSTQSANVATSNGISVDWRCLHIDQTTQQNGGIIVGAGTSVDWCRLTMSGAATDTLCLGSFGPHRMTNSGLECTGASYSAVVMPSTLLMHCDNVRAVGNPGASSGSRHGLVVIGGTNSVSVFSRVVAIDNVGVGIRDASGTASSNTSWWKCMAIDNGSDGFQFPSTSSQTGVRRMDSCVATGNGGYGINAQSAARMFVTNCRLRDNTSGNFNGFANHQTDLDNFTTDADDAADYVNAGANNFRIKSTAAFANRGIGVSQEAPSGGGPAVYFG